MARFGKANRAPDSTQPSAPAKAGEPRCCPDSPTIPRWRSDSRSLPAEQKKKVLAEARAESGAQPGKRKGRRGQSAGHHRVRSSPAGRRRWASATERGECRDPHSRRGGPSRRHRPARRPDRAHDWHAAGDAREGQRTARTRRVADFAGKPADGARDGEPRLAAPLRRGPRADGGQLRRHRRGAEQSRAARRAGRAIHAGRLVGEDASSARSSSAARTNSAARRMPRRRRSTPTTACSGAPRRAGSTPRRSATRSSRRAAGSSLRRRTARSSPTSATATSAKASARSRFEVSANYRSVYLPIVRDFVPEALDVFDFAEPSLVVADARRDQRARHRRSTC